MRRVGVLVLASGCSVALGRAPSKLPDDGRVSCNAAPAAIDTVVALTGVVMLVAGIRAYRANPSDSQAAGLGELGIAMGVIGGVPWALSAAYGWSEHARCTQMQEMSPTEKARAVAARAEAVATAGRCSDAYVLATQVEMLDHVVHAELKSRIGFRDCIAADEAQRLRDKADRVLREAADEQAKRSASARDLVKRARDSARAGDCTSVRVAGEQILSLDEEIHRVWFRTDADIARCLATE